MTAETIEDVWARSRRPGILAYRRVELEGPGMPSVTVHGLARTAYREVTTVSAGDAAVVDVPFRVELPPTEPAGPTRRD